MRFNYFALTRRIRDWRFHRRARRYLMTPEQADAVREALRRLD